MAAGDDAGTLESATAMAELSKRLGLLESVRHLCESVDIPIPGIVVVGEQSAGKSSLLENISGIQFPRAENTCTRMPCVLTLLSDSSVNPHALVSMDPTFTDAEELSIDAIEKKIQNLTETHAKGKEFISKTPIYVKVVRGTGPQLSLIDLPGVTHNSERMPDIHEVTRKLVETYIKQEEMVILCVLTAMSDFGNAEVIKLARKYDPEGKRTLGVVTKCDDAARAESSDVVDKAMMLRKSDVKLTLGFHCVVNRSQKDLNEGLSRDELFRKEAKVFESSERFARLPKKFWGTLALTEKVGKIQASRVDECLPAIREKVRVKLTELKRELRNLPPQPVSEADQHRQFDLVLRRVQEDLQRRVRAEFMGSTEDDKVLAIAPRVAEKIRNFRDYLREASPEWLGEDMIEEIQEVVEDYANGYTVDNLMGQQVFVNFVKLKFVEEGLLAEAADDLTISVANHLRTVVTHVIETHSASHTVLANRLADVAHDVVDEMQAKAKRLCDALAEAQQVTSTTQGSYMIKLTSFRKTWYEKAASSTIAALFGGKEEGDESTMGLSKAFVELLEEAAEEPQKFAVLEICASLHVYTSSLIDSYVDMAAKLVKFNMVEKLTEQLEVTFRSKLQDKIGTVFPVDAEVMRQHEDLEAKVKGLQEFRDQLATLRSSAPLASRPPSRRSVEKQVVAEQGIPTVHLPDEERSVAVDHQPSPHAHDEHHDGGDDGLHYDASTDLFSDSFGVPAAQSAGTPELGPQPGASGTQSSDTKKGATSKAKRVTKKR